MAENGVIYYATGEKYIDQTKRSARSLKKHNDLHVTLFTDRTEVKSDCIDHVIQIDPGPHPFYDRINYFKRTPYDRTLHLDTDTIVLGDITEIFDMLDRFSIVAAMNESRDTANERQKFETVDINVPDSFPEYQCGVVGFRDVPSVHELFTDWQDRYSAYKDRFLLDQPHFREALYHHDLALGTLPPEYNLLLNFGGYVQGEVKIVHYAGVKPLSIPFLFDDGLEDAIRKVNRDAPAGRVLYYDRWNQLRIVPAVGNGPLVLQTIQSLMADGISRTLQKGYRKIERAVRKRI